MFIESDRPQLSSWLEVRELKYSLQTGNAPVWYDDRTVSSCIKICLQKMDSPHKGDLILNLCIVKRPVTASAERPAASWFHSTLSLCTAGKDRSRLDMTAQPAQKAPTHCSAKTQTGYRLHVKTGRALSSSLPLPWFRRLFLISPHLRVEKSCHLWF